jgi:hypothetical protein
MLIRSINNRLPGLLVISVPFAGWSLFNVGNAFGFTASYVIGLVALIINFPRLMLITREEKSKYFLEFYSPWIVACFFSIIGLIFWEHADAGQYFLSLMHLIFFVVITYSLLQVKDAAIALDFYAMAYTLTALFVALIGLIDFALLIISGNGLGIQFNTVVRTEPSNALIGLLPRASSVFFEPGWFAHYLLIDIIIVMLWLLPRAFAMRRWWLVWALRICVVLIFLALIATLSAATYLIATLVMLFVILNRPRPLRKLTWIVICLVIFYFVPFPNDLPNPIQGTFERFLGLATGASVAGESVDARSDELAAAFHVFTETLLLGIGYGQSTHYISSVSGVGTGGISSFYGILMAETGLIGLMAFIVSIVGLNYKLWRLQQKIAKQDISRAQIIFCCRCVILAETFYLNFFSAMASPTYVTSFWFALMLLNIGWPLGKYKAIKIY